MVTVTLNGQIDRYTRAGTGTGRQGVGQPVALNGCQRMQAGRHRRAQTGTLGKNALHCCLRSKFVKLNSQQQTEREGREREKGERESTERQRQHREREKGRGQTTVGQQPYFN